MGWLIYAIALWLTGMTGVLTWLTWRFFKAYIGAATASARYQEKIVQIEQSYHERLGSMQNLFKVQLDALQREITDIRQRWTVSSTTQVYQERYIEVLEENHHTHGIALPPKPRMLRSRPITSPTNGDDVRDLDSIDELLLERDIQRAGT
jgi:hypothetical protein